MRGRTGAIFMLLGAACFLIHGQRGGCIMKKRGVVSIPLSFIPLILSGLSTYSSPHAGRSAQIRGDDSDPPRNGGGMRPRIAAPSNRALCRPQGVAIVGIYPCGKARNTYPETGVNKRKSNL